MGFPHTPHERESLVLSKHFGVQEAIGLDGWKKRGGYAALEKALKMEPADAPAYQTLRHQAETEWLPQLMGVLGLSPQSLPVIWDADFLFGPKTTGGEDTHVLCEINASAVWPFPPTAAPTVASAALSQLPH